MESNLTPEQTKVFEEIKEIMISEKKTFIQAHQVYYERQFREDLYRILKILFNN